MIRTLGTVLLLSILPGCTSTNLNHALGTPKNPAAVFADPDSRTKTDESSFIKADYALLLTSIDTTVTRARTKMTPVSATVMRAYIEAGLNLSDTYCYRFLIKTG